MGSPSASAIVGSVPSAATVALRVVSGELAGSVTSAICTGIDFTRVSTEQGLLVEHDGVVRYGAAGEPAAWAADNAIVGQVVELKQYGETEWRRVRVLTRRNTLGMVRLNVKAEFSE